MSAAIWTPHSSLVAAFPSSFFFLPTTTAALLCNRTSLTCNKCVCFREHINSAASAGAGVRTAAEKCSQQIWLRLRGRRGCLCRRRGGWGEGHRLPRGDNEAYRRLWRRKERSGCAVDAFSRWATDKRQIAETTKCGTLDNKNLVAPTLTFTIVVLALLSYLHFSLLFNLFFILYTESQTKFLVCVHKSGQHHWFCFCCDLLQWGK